MSCPPKMRCRGREKNWRCFAAGGVGTRHPRKGAVEQPVVAEREPVENEAAKGKVPSMKLLPSNRRFTKVNLLILKWGC